MNANTRAGRLSVGVIGMGHVGPVIASALRQAGHRIVGVSAHSPRSIEHAEDMLPGIGILDVETLARNSEVVVLAVPDDTIEPLTKGLAELGVWRPGQLVIHLSGAHGITALHAASACGAIALAIHPVMTFTGTSVDVARLVGTPFAVTAPTFALPIAHALVVEMGGEPFDIDEADRTLYHCALTHGANFLATIVNQSLTLLTAAGVDRASAVATPLLAAALDRALRQGIAGISGPIPRGDSGTIATHIAALAATTHAAGEDMHIDEADPATSWQRLEPQQGGNILDTYTFMTRQTVQMLRDAGRLSENSAQEILSVLATG